MQQPTIGRIVHYTLNEGDVGLINQHRTENTDVGNAVQPGQVYPAMVVRVFDPSATTVNLQVFLDGSGSYWATSRREAGEGESVGFWVWPPRA